MATQGSALREESQEDRRFSGARELVETIDDQNLKDNVKSQIAVSLMEMGKNAAVRYIESGNGSSPTVSTPAPANRSGAQPPSNTE
jgi:HEAT repeat protein